MTISSTANDNTKVELHSPGDLLAAIPHLLGFVPTNSVVALAHRGHGGRRLGTVLRADLPAPGQEHAFATEMYGPFAAEDTRGITLAVVGESGEAPRTNTTRRPYRHLVDTVAEVLAAAGSEVLHALWVPELRAGVRWECYWDSTCTGSLPDMENSVIAAASTSAGMVTFASRDAMQGLLAADDPAALERRSFMIESAVDKLDGNADRKRVTEQGLAAVRATLRQAVDADVELSDEQVVRLAVALSESRVRDACLTTALPPATLRTAAAERLWLALTRATPAPERAEPATLLGYSAYMRGDGAFAGMAFDNAEEAHPGHVLAGLLSRAIRHGIPPGRLKHLGRLDGFDDLWAPPPTTNGPSSAKGDEPG